VSARGKCPECGYRVRLRKNGRPQRHRLYIGEDFLRFCPQDAAPVVRQSPTLVVEPIRTANGPGGASGEGNDPGAGAAGSSGEASSLRKRAD